ncbi:DNA mismatch repair endonuclease MutL [Paenibacillus sp. YN15]|uniref:DNA mismatch repair endonuclease MutL n=1 Tax=Paenibacillus sp. YN15 TaxID=1742774 RepID=UPI000DCE91CD|nr:DNA mismatch repair endonuclease MutL [Paenibacillus sp. YN15]RAV02376.1 DNA mismatch repair endonuclease MutL [Paenibacillus sp. YN15]
MGIIRVLDDHIANQIAAGEVVERPSSVVKELVENAIDAGSTRIDVTVEDGGLTLIRIADNGGGIGADDLERAFQRHATSKISSGKDLFHIRTLGFRGEALPSIAAVSKVECVTAADDSGLGRRIELAGGQVLAHEDAAASRGTDIRIKELFYNTPARLKYMKTIQTELGHISDFIYRLALSHPEIAFLLKHNGNTLVQTIGNGDLLSVIAAIYGTGVAKKMLAVKGESLDYRVSGYICRPEETRAGRHAISTIINGRYIRNYPVAQALIKAYHTLLPINRFPIAVLHIEMEPSLLDVNVHPSKMEVRFSKEPELLEFVEATAAGVLRGTAHIPQAAQPQAKTAVKPAVIQEQLELYRPQPQPPQATSAAAPAREQAALPRPPQPETGWRLPQAPPEPVPDDRREARSAGGSFAGPAAGAGAAGGYPAPARNQRQQEQPPRPETVQKLLGALEDVAGADEADGTELLPEPKRSLPKLPELDPIGQLHGTYIVAQNPEGLYLIDQHAAHERINYEYYYELFGRPQEASQELLVPITLEFTPSEAEVLKGRLSVLEQSGVFLEAFGGSTFLVRAYPHWLPPGEEREIVTEICEWVLAERKQVDLSKLREKASTLCSCKASIKANQSLTRVEMEALLDRLSACRMPYTCPHGRPIVISFSTYELEKMFKRVM